MRNERRASSWIPTSVGFVLAAAGGLYVGRAVVREWEQVGLAIAGADWRWLAISFLFGGLGMTGIGLAWRKALALVGVSASRGRALAWYFLGQLGKYIPGGIWPVVGRGELAVRGGASRSPAYAAVLLSMGATYLAGILFVVGLLPFDLQVVGAAGRVVWLLLLGPVGVVALHPAVLTRFLDVLRKVTGLRIEISPPSWGASMRLVAAHLPSWAAVGLATWGVAVALQGSASVLNLVVATVLAWVVGFLVLPVPGGLGVREAVFTVAATSMGAGMAGAVAVSARLLFILVDATGAGLSLLVSREPGPGGPRVSERSTSASGGSPSAPPGDS